MMSDWVTRKKILLAAHQFSTPFYGYDEPTLRANFQALRQNLPNEIDIFYSIKANPNIALCSILRSMGAHAEVSSYYEMEAALQAGFKPKNIIFLGPAKSDREIEACLKKNIFSIVCESLHEFSRISLLARSHNTLAHVALRINPTHVSTSALLKMGGKASQFGMDESIIFENKKYFLNNPYVKITGIHIYNGTRILNSSTIIENTLYILSLAKKIQTEWKLSFKMVDIGGGLGVSYFNNESSIDLVALKAGLSKCIETYIKSYPHTRIILESGRYLVAESGVFVSTIMDIKNSKGITFAITNGGTNCHMAAVGIGGVVKKNFPICVIYKKKHRPKNKITYNITGPLCTPNDLIAKKIELAYLSIGDFIVIKKSGAYGPTASPVMFLSHGFPTEILFKEDNLYCIRNCFDYDMFFKHQYIIPEK